MGENRRRKLQMPRAKGYDEMSNEELREALQELKMLKMSAEGQNRSGNTHPGSGMMRQTRIAIARILTILRKRGIRASVS